MQIFAGLTPAVCKFLTTSPLPNRGRAFEALFGKSMLGTRRESMSKIEAALSARLKQERIKHRIISRVKSPYIAPVAINRLFRPGRRTLRLRDSHSFTQGSPDQIGGGFTEVRTVEVTVRKLR